MEFLLSLFRERLGHSKLSITLDVYGHLMPGALDETRAILTWIAETLGPATYVNLMDQYRPAGKVNGDRYPEIDRPLTSSEFAEAQAIARELGLRRLDRRRTRPRLEVRRRFG